MPEAEPHPAGVVATPPFQSIDVDLQASWMPMLVVAMAQVLRSPAPIMMLIGVFLVQAFVSWSARLAARGGTPLVALEVFDTPGERAAIYSMFTIGAVGSALTLLIPLRLLWW